MTGSTPKSNGFLKQVAEGVQEGGNCVQGIKSHYTGAPRFILGTILLRCT